MQLVHTFAKARAHLFKMATVGESVTQTNGRRYHCGAKFLKPSQTNPPPLIRVLRLLYVQPSGKNEKIRLTLLALCAGWRHDDE